VAATFSYLAEKRRLASIETPPRLGGGSRLLCRCRTCGQNPRQEKGGAAAEKDPVIRDAHEWSLF